MNLAESTDMAKNSADSKTLAQVVPMQTRNTDPLPTPVRIDRLAKYLEGYEDKLKDYIIRGFEEGFSVESNVKFSSKEPRNLKSAYLNPKVIDDKLKKKLN